MQLVEEAIDGCWIGHRARTASMAYPSGIGSVYSPPTDDPTRTTAAKVRYVETVIEVSHRTYVSLLSIFPYAN
jgi:hypothetical protein